VELVVVIVAIAILAALIVPTVQVSVESSRRMRCISNVRQLSTGVRLYAIDNYNHIPSLATWDTAIAPYLGLQSSDPNLQTKGVFRCPSGWLAGADTASDQRTYNYNFHSEPFTVNTNSVTQVYKSPALGEYLHPDQTLVITCWWFFRWSGNWTTPPSTTHPSGRPTGYLDGHVVVETAPPFYQNGSPPNAALVQY
jgi:type II secretory pathway pseudopilin PulG